jgi:hypothetical protein
VMPFCLPIICELAGGLCKQTSLSSISTCQINQCGTADSSRQISSIKHVTMSIPNENRGKKPHVHPRCIRQSCRACQNLSLRSHRQRQSRIMIDPCISARRALTPPRPEEARAVRVHIDGSEPRIMATSADQHGSHQPLRIRASDRGR